MRPSHSPQRLFAPSLALSLALAACAPASRAGERTSDRAAASPAVIDTVSIAAREQTADQQVLHALNRAAFGPRPGDVERVRAMGVDRWIARQLDPASIPDAAGDAATRRYATQGLPLDALLRDYTPAAFLRRELRNDGSPTREDSVAYREAARRAQQVGMELTSLKVARAVASERQLQEVMTDFWENHFNVFAGKGPAMRHFLVTYSRDAIRPRAMGKFRDLLGAVAASPAMLTYLDNSQSVADSGRPTLAGLGTGDSGLGRRRARRPGMIPSPQSRVPSPAARQRRGLNENYARELLELHTLGVDGGYTQQDIIEVARAFTGWTIRPPNPANAQQQQQQRRLGRFAEPIGEGSIFVPFVHDAGAKTVLGHRLAAGRGVEDGREVLDIVARHPATARFIATKLARRFVSDTPPAALVERATATFTRTDGDIRETLRTILTSPEFFSRAAWRAKVKTPFEVVASALRATGAAPDATPRTAGLVARLGQPLYLHQAPNGYPETGDAWINTGAILNRINFGMAMGAERIPGARRATWPWPAALDTATRERQVDAVVATLFGGYLSPDTRAVLVSGTNPLASATGADSLLAPETEDDATMGTMSDVGTVDRRPRRVAGQPRGMGMRGRDPFAPAELTGLRQVVGLAIGAPEFQRR